MENAFQSLLGKLKPGNHIARESHSGRGLLELHHHGIYMGIINGYHTVTHLKKPNKKSSSKKNPVACCTICGYNKLEDGGRVTSCLDCFSEGERTFLIRYIVNPPYPLAEEKLTPGNVIHGYEDKELYLELYSGAKLFGHMKVSSAQNFKVDDQVYLSNTVSCITSEEVIEAAQSEDNSKFYSFLSRFGTKVGSYIFALDRMTGQEGNVQTCNKNHKVGYKPGEAFHRLTDKLMPGDHIASTRRRDKYEHHGIYMGKVKGYHTVTHFKAPNKIPSIIGGTGESVAKCSICDFQVPRDGGKVTSCIDCFCSSERTFIIKYRVRTAHLPAVLENLTFGSVLHGYRNNKVYLELYNGTTLFGHMKIPTDENFPVDNHVCLSKFSSIRTPEQVIEAAKSNYHYGRYNLFLHNCEDFAVYCITGKERSIQAENKLPKPLYMSLKTCQLLTDPRKLRKELKDQRERILDSWKEFRNSSDSLM